MCFPSGAIWKYDFSGFLKKSSRAITGGFSTFWLQDENSPAIIIKIITKQIFLISLSILMIIKATNEKVQFKKTVEKQLLLIIQHHDRI
jgi:hypothetical protein